ncbi:MAG: hypothetical protein Q4B26_08635 [Eubacteriales bacterium]|nr:hypothetical protein [Eubacteriales bacterium]
MKRRGIAVLVAGALCLLPNTVFAEGNIEVTHKNLIMDSEDGSGVFYARVENTGDAAVTFDEGQLIVYSETGEELYTEDYIVAIPQHVEMQPGDYFYVKQTLWDTGLEGKTIGSYELVIEPQEADSSYHVDRFQCESSFELTDSYDSNVYVTFSNDTDDKIQDFYVIGALYDQNDNLIFVSESVYGTLTVHAGSMITDEMYIDSDTRDYFDANGIVPTRSDGMVCTDWL